MRQVWSKFRKIAGDEGFSADSCVGGGIGTGASVVAHLYG
jgi:hypothetical protein